MGLDSFGAKKESQPRDKGATRIRELPEWLSHGLSLSKTGLLRFEKTVFVFISTFELCRRVWGKTHLVSESHQLHLTKEL